MVKEFYPELFDKLVRYDTFAVVRDPKSRFLSSVRENLGVFQGLNITQMLPKDIQYRSLKLCERLSAASAGELDTDLIHFQTQTSFIEVDGCEIVKNLYHINQLDVLGKYIERVYGVQMPSKEKRNATVTYKNITIAKIALWLRKNTGLRNYLPDQLKVMLRKIVYGQANNNWRKSILTVELEQFIYSYYSDDFKLVDKVYRMHNYRD